MAIHPLSKIDPHPEKKLTRDDLHTFLDFCFKECGGYFLPSSISSHDQSSKNLFIYYKKMNPEYFTEIDDHKELSSFFTELTELNINAKVFRLTKQYGLARRINRPVGNRASNIFELYRYMMKSCSYPEWISPESPEDANTVYIKNEMFNPDTGEMFETFLDKIYESPNEADLNKAIICLSSRKSELISNGFEYVFVPTVFEGKMYKRFSEVIKRHVSKVKVKKSATYKQQTKSTSSKVSGQTVTKIKIILSHLISDISLNELKPTLHKTEKKYAGVDIFDMAYETGYMSAEEKYRYDRELFLENELTVDDFDHETGKLNKKIFYNGQQVGAEFFFGIYGR